MVEDPARFDVIVTDNMFGDIITDLGAAIQGGLGIASGANINPIGVSMFEPIGGTAPGFEGTGKINPLAAIGAAAMMLTANLGETEAAGHRELPWAGSPDPSLAPGRGDGDASTRRWATGWRPRPPSRPA
jgi:3-isopropylmalate dehydrogenase